jgi:hypothetical protein
MSIPGSVADSHALKEAGEAAPRRKFAEVAVERWLNLANLVRLRANPDLQVGTEPSRAPLPSQPDYDYPDARFWNFADRVALNGAWDTGFGRPVSRTGTAEPGRLTQQQVKELIAERVEKRRAQQGRVKPKRDPAPVVSLTEEVNRPFRERSPDIIGSQGSQHFVLLEGLGALMLKQREPLKLGPGRPRATDSRYGDTKIPWQPACIEQLIELVESVHAVLALLADARSRPEPKTEILASASLAITLPAIPHRAVLVRDGRGIATVSPDPYAAFLDDLSGTDVTRIKRCAVCTELFYAYRAPVVACSSGCSNVERARRYRAASSAKPRPGDLPG